MSDFKPKSEMKKDELFEYATHLETQLEGVVDIPAAADCENVSQAILYVMSQIGYVQKQESDELPYSVATEPAFIRAVRPHMIDTGLFIVPREMELLERNDYETRRGSRAQGSVLACTFEFIHSPSATSLEVQTIGEGLDYGDKSMNKAMTVALKYAVRQSFYIETGDDPDYTNSGKFERAVERESKERTSARSEGRMQNQWEPFVLKKIVDEYELVPDKRTTIGILNQSHLFEVPFGDLNTAEAVAYVLAYQESVEADPDMSDDERAAQLATMWQTGASELGRFREAANGLLGEPDWDPNSYDNL